MQRPRWIFVAAATGLIALTAAGCTSDDEPSPPPTSAAPPPARYSGLNGDCPTLASSEAKKFNGTGTGRPRTPTLSPIDYVTTVRCGWNLDGAPSVSTTIEIYPNGYQPAGTGAGNAGHYFTVAHQDVDRQAAEDAANVVVSDLTPSTGKAFVITYGLDDRVVQTTLTENTMITVTVRDRESDAPRNRAHTADIERRLRPVAEAVTTEIIGQLR